VLLVLSYDMSAIIRPLVRVTSNSVPLGELVTVECTLYSALTHVIFIILHLPEISGTGRRCFNCKIGRRPKNI
jgi:hypothetical protein